MDYILHILIFIGIYVIAASGLNLLVGYTGLLSMAHASFFGVGAYTVAILGLKQGWTFWFSLPCGALFAALLSALIAVPSLKVHEDYFVLTTFGLQVIATSFMTNWSSLTGGSMGLPGIPTPKLLGISLDNHWQMFLLVWTFLFATLWILRRLVNAPFGRVLRAIREDEVFAQSMGKDVLEFKVKSFVLCAGAAGLAGGLYATYVSYVDPTSFTVSESIYILSLVIVGGAGNFWGPIIGAVVLIALPELLRFVGLPTSIAANTRQVLYGGLLVVMMLWRPQGLIGKFTFHQKLGK